MGAPPGGCGCAAWLPQAVHVMSWHCPAAKLCTPPRPLASPPPLPTALPLPAPAFPLQFLLFHACRQSPDHCRALLHLLISRLTDKRQPPVARSACAAYAASFLARSAAACIILCPCLFLPFYSFEWCQCSACAAHASFLARSAGCGRGGVRCVGSEQRRLDQLQARRALGSPSRSSRHAHALRCCTWHHTHATLLLPCSPPFWMQGRLLP